MPERYEGEQVEAWQHLIDTATVWDLQGSYGRMAAYLIETDVCKAPSWADA